MLTPELKLQMLRFVHCFEVVKERQFKKFFSDWGEGTVNFALKDLISKGRIIRHGADYLSYARHLPHPLHAYSSCIAAVDVMIMIRSKQILWFNREEYPLELTFLTTDNVIYDVVVFDNFWSAKYVAIERTRDTRYLPPGEPDPAEHIAVVETEDIAKKVSSLGFALYAQPHYDGHVEFFELE